MPATPAPTATAARGGLAFALGSAATFGTAGVFASALIDADWSPAAAVTARITVAALVLTIPALVVLRGRWRMLAASWRAVVAYGLVGVAGCQLCYFNALEHLSVGVALLLEYLGTVLVVGWVWARTREAPRPLTLGGTALALGGLVLVLDLTGAQRVDPVGVVWGLVAAVALATYFVLSARTDDPLPPIVTVWGGMVVAAVTLALLGLVGVLRMHVGSSTVSFAGTRTSWLVPVLGLAVVAAALAYLLGIEAARRLGATVASFVGLTEVVFAVLFAWLFLAQLPGAVQLLGGVLIVGGAACVRVDELRKARVARREALTAPAGYMVG
ncbi:EamA family transporter [Jatrophihabitans sp. YIM 134969]